MAPPITYVPRAAQAQVAKTDDEIADALLDIDRLSQELLEADGDPGLVAEKILGSRALENKVLAAISSDASSLDAFQAKARAYTIMKLMQVFNTLQASVLINIEHLKPEETIRQLIKLASVMGDLSDRKVSTQNINVTENILKMLPPAVAQDISTLIEMHNNPKTGAWEQVKADADAQG